MYLAEAPYEVCLKLANSEKMLEELRKVKRNEMGDLEWAKRESKWLCEVTKEMKDNLLGIDEITNLEVSPEGIVTWANSSNATGYQISIDNGSTFDDIEKEFGK